MTLTFGSSSIGMMAQEEEYKWSAGMNCGISGYLGEFNGANIFKSPGVNLSAQVAYLYDTRWNFNGVLSFSTLKGSTDVFSQEGLTNLPSSFNSSLWQLDCNAEFNFMPYGIGETYKRLSRWTPFIGAGIGVAMAMPKGGSTSFAPEIPISFGVKYKIKERFNLKAELTITKLFTDSADGLQDVYGIESSWFKNTDWSASFTVGFSYEFGKRCPTCHYVD